MFSSARALLACAMIATVALQRTHASDNVHPDHVHAHGIPEGSYQDSCAGCSLTADDAVLTCLSCYRHISDSEHSTENSQITVSDCEGKNIRNRNGQLECGDSSGDEGFLYLDEINRFQAHGDNTGNGANFVPPTEDNTMYHGHNMEL